MEIPITILVLVGAGLLAGGIAVAIASLAVAGVILLAVGILLIKATS